MTDKVTKAVNKKATTEMEPKKKVRRTQRIKEVTAEYEAAVHDKVAEENLVATVDDALFIVDTAGSKRGRRRVINELLPKVEKTFVSKTEAHLIRKLQKNPRQQTPTGLVAHSEQYSNASMKDLWSDNIELPKHSVAPRALAIPVEARPLELQVQAMVQVSSIPDGSVAPVNPRQKRIIRENDSTKALEDAERLFMTGQEKRRKGGLRVALPGQSYNPSTDDHQDVIAEAVAVELKRQAKLSAAKKANDSELPARAGTALQALMANPKELTALMLGNDSDSDNSDDSSDEEEDENQEEGAPRKRKAAVKLTRAQRNKKRARRIAEYEEAQRRSAIRLDKSIANVEAVKRRISREDRDRDVARQLQKNIIKEGRRSALTQMTDAQVSTVPLSDELGGSLRTVIPKGISVVDRVATMIANGDAVDPTIRNRRKIENPHGAKRQKWIPKYKHKTEGGRPL